MRIYHNVSQGEPAWQKLCKLYCRHQHVDLCNVRSGSINYALIMISQFHHHCHHISDDHRQLPKIGNLNKKFPVGRFWRFQVLQSINLTSMMGMMTMVIKKNANHAIHTVIVIIIMTQVLGDPTVEVFASRDVDSFILPRWELNIRIDHNGDTWKHWSIKHDRITIKTLFQK